MHFECASVCCSHALQARACRTQDGGEFFQEWTESSDSFDQMGLNESLLRGIYAYGASRQGFASQCSRMLSTPAGQRPLIVKYTFTSMLSRILSAPARWCAFTLGR